MQEIQTKTRWSSTPGLSQGTIRLDNGFKTSRTRGSVTLPSLGPNLSDLQQLATVCGFGLATIWQTALAVTLHLYNPSEVVSFACEDEFSGRPEKHSNVQIYTLRIEPTETIFDLLQRFHNREFRDYSTHRIAFTRLSDAGLSSGACKLALRCHMRAGKRSFTDMDQTLDSLFNIAPRKANRLTGCLEYSASEISEGLAWSMLYSVDLILRQMSSSMQTSIEDMNACSQYDLDSIRRYTLFVAQAEEKCVHDLVLDQCRATPDALAIVSPWEKDSDITYAELDQMTSQLAHRLIEEGVGPEVFVLCVFEKSAYAIVARLAVLRAGGAYIMIDASNSPPKYLNSIIRQANVKIMLTATRFMARPEFKSLVPNVLEVSQATLKALPVPLFPPCVDVKSDNACLILFTSGSTGVPKGIIQTHRSYATAIREYAKALKLGPKTRMFQHDDFNFDISNNEYLAPLVVGGCCCVPEVSRAENPPTIERLVSEINTMEVTTIFLTPTVAIQLNPDEVSSSLELLCVGGEAMATILVKKWKGKTKLINQYGMGEVATFCAYNDSNVDEKPANIGRPACNTIWLVSLASPEQLVPMGAIGEVLIEGPNIARGYLDGQVRTAGARFLDVVPSWMAEIHPGRAVSRMYLSGDLARYNHDGTLEYVGRKDLLLKVDGCRLDAVEVEHCARKSLHPQDAIVVDLLGSIAEGVLPVLTAYLYLHDHALAKVASDGQTVFRPSTSCPKASAKVSTITADLQEILPSHMIPTKFLIVNQIPKTASKKTDRKTLHVQAEQYWKQAFAPGRRVLLVTHPGTASNILVRILSLRSQPDIMPHNVATGHFFLPTTAFTNRSELRHKHLQDWSEEERSHMRCIYQNYFDELEKFVTAAESEGKIAFIKEHARFLIEPVSKQQRLLGQDSIKEAPWTVQVPAEYGPEVSHSMDNPSLLPDNYLKTWLPAFVIRHPALTFPLQYRAYLASLSGTVDHETTHKHLPSQLTYHWSRKLHDLFSEHLHLITKAAENGEINWPIVIDTDDILMEPSVITKFCKLVGLDPTRLAFAGASEPEEQEFPGQPSDNRVSAGLSIEKEAVKWREEFGEVGGAELEMLVRDAMVDYDVLRGRRLRV